MAYTPAALDHVNIYVRNAERAHRWYTDVSTTWPGGWPASTTSRRCTGG